MVTDPIHNPCGGDPALDFVNTIEQSRTGPAGERLVDYGAWLEWSRQAGHLSAAEVRVLARAAQRHPAAARQALARVRSLRAALLALLQAAITGGAPPARALEALHAALERALPHARLARRGDGYAWGWTPPGEDLDAPLRPVVRAGADLLVSPALAEVKVCGGKNCGWLFLDRTRNKKRRWCEMKTCGNREKVRALRARRRRNG